MRALVFASWLALSAGALRVVLVADAPDVVNYRHTRGVSAAVPRLRIAHPAVEWRFVHPACAACSTLDRATPERAVQTLLENSWDAAELSAAVNQSLESGESVLVVSIDTAIPPSLAFQHPSASFVELNPDSNAGSKLRKVPNLASFNVPTAKGAYTNGVASAMVARGAGGKVAVFTPSNPGLLGKDYTDVVRAYRQGASDASAELCSIVVPVPIAVSTEWNPTVFNEVERAAMDALWAGYAVVQAELGPYNAAVLSGLVEYNALTNRSTPAYATTGVSMGAFETSGTPLNTRWLSSVTVDWQAAISKIVSDFSGGLGAVESLRDPSDTFWTPAASQLDTFDTSAEVSRVQARPCSAPVKSLQMVVAAVADTLDEAFALSDIPTTTPSCRDLPLSKLKSTRRLVSGCFRGTKVRLVGVGINVNIIGAVDVMMGAFYADYHLYLKESVLQYDNAVAAYDAMRHGDECQDESIKCLCPDFAEGTIPFISPARVENFTRIVSLMNVFPPEVRTIYVRRSRRRIIDHFRITGTHHFKLDLTEWPLDTQHLSIVLSHTSDSTTDGYEVQFCHMPGYAGLSPTSRYFPGMELKMNQRAWNVALNTTCWPELEYTAAYQTGECNPDGTTSRPVWYTKRELPFADVSCTCLGGTNPASRYIFTPIFQRPRLPIFFRMFLPPIFISMVVQGVWFLYPRVVETRLSVCGSSLVTAVLFHVNIARSFPDTSTLTRADRFMAVTYWNILVVFIFVYYQSLLHQGDMPRLAWNSFRTSRVWGPATAVLNACGMFVTDDIKDLVGWVLIMNCFTGLIVFYIISELLRKYGEQYLEYLDIQNTKAEFESWRDTLK
ncbi:hypothetical protein DIPPA_25398 [Diplonema papillatum]|nr:hypothetical protein DIPPA_25398 [Diplonema papillatum]